ncbi:MAG: response regulator [Promethearchaeota archaeon]|jgi:CheY-like chemotaxis protein
MTKKIMSVDDEEDILITMRTIFLNEGDNFEFIGIKSGDECIKHLNNGELPDLILLDIMMPEMSGWEVFNRIRENPDWAHIPVIFLTAREDKIAKDAGTFLGDDYIEKPIDPRNLIERINLILQKI